MDLGPEMPEAFFSTTPAPSKLFDSRLGGGHNKQNSMGRLSYVDLEGKLISNAVSQIPRSGLFSFLEFLGHYGGVVLFTRVPPRRNRAIQDLLVSGGAAPGWFAELDSLHPTQAKVKLRSTVH